MPEPLAHAARPCPNCPWRRDVEPGEFPACRYDALAATAGQPGTEADLFAPLFACHKSREGAEYACAGWLASVGRDHLGVRFAVITGRLDPATLDPGPDWPPLFDSYAEMAATQAGDDR